MNALVTIETLTPAVVFAPGGVESIISKLEIEVRAISTDISTEAGRKALGSLAYKVARSKTALDEMGKDLVADLKSQTGKIDAERRIIRDRLDALKDEVRKPLTDWEDAETNRVAAHEAVLAEIMQAANLWPDADSSSIRQRAENVSTLAARDWQEFLARATATVGEVRKVLETALAQAEKREAEAVELARLRAEQIAREQKEREDKIAAEAAERARIEAETKARREAVEVDVKAETERKRAENEKADAIARAEQAEADKKVAAAKAEQAAKNAVEAAERRQAAAIEAERKRVADEEARLTAERAKRQADTKHRTKINNEVLAALVKLGVDEGVARDIIVAIVKGEIPHTRIGY